MALHSFRFRRSLTTAPCLLYRRRHFTLSQISTPPLSSPLRTPAPRPSSPPSPLSSVPFLARHSQSRLFRSSPTWLAPPKTFRNNNYKNDNTEDEEQKILFEGCDYNHWLFTIDFPKDPVPSPEEKVQFYVETLAKGLNISIEEAKLKMYACSTSTYNGFQAVMTEEESQKFEGLPGVGFILPDSYIDPANKEYGGDKYINGTIIPRAPPFQHDRSRNSRSGDRNRGGGFERHPRMDRQESPMLNQQGNPRQPNYGPRQNYGQPSQGFAPQPQQGFAPQQQYGQPQQGFAPQQQYGQRQQGFAPQQQYGQPQQGFAPQQQYGQPQQGFAPQQQHGQPQQGFSPQQQYSQPHPQQQYSQPQRDFAPQQHYGQPQRGFAPQQYEQCIPPQQQLGLPQQQYDPSQPFEKNDPSKLNHGQTQ